jgi:folate-dependent phosphoribosylglycinamide formyltransferase PurN
VHWVVPSSTTADNPSAERVYLPRDTDDTLAARILVEGLIAYPEALAIVARGEARF